MKKTLLEEFDIKENTKPTDFISDYDVFKDKALLDELRRKIIEKIIDEKDLDFETNKDKISYFVNSVIDEYDLTTLQRTHINNLIDNEINGYGPITEVLEDDNVTEIMVNSPSEIYVEVDGNLVKDDSISFINNEHILRIIDRLISGVGKTIDQSNPMVDARLEDGSRLNAIIPPLSLNGPVLTIRKFKKEIDEIEDLIGNGTLTPYMARFLDASVKAKLNILVCGGTGSGKTTLLNVLSNFIGKTERIITIEDAAELRLSGDHVISLETRDDNYQNGNLVTIRDLVRNSLRMRPDRIIVGEVRGAEAFDMLQAMNTGHEGSLTTLHANSVNDALYRLESMVLMNEVGLPVKAIREYIESAIDIVIEVKRLSDGRRKITNISEVVGFNNEDIKLMPIFAFMEQGMDKNKQVLGEFVLYNYIPSVYYKMKNRGITELDDIYEPLINKRKKEKKDKKEELL